MTHWIDNTKQVLGIAKDQDLAAALSEVSDKKVDPSVVSRWRHKGIHGSTLALIRLLLNKIYLRGWIGEENTVDDNHINDDRSSQCE